MKYELALFYACVVVYRQADEITKVCTIPMNTRISDILAFALMLLATAALITLIYVI